MQKNPGFMVLYTFIKDALLSKNGIVKVYWDKSEREERETYLDQPTMPSIMAADPDVGGHRAYRAQGRDGEITHDVTLVERKNYGCAKAVGVPPEEFGISPRRPHHQGLTYCFHEVSNTEADLIDQGYDEPGQGAADAGSHDKEEQTARDTLTRVRIDARPTR
jgi:hypothetical protein